MTEPVFHTQDTLGEERLRISNSGGITVPAIYLYPQEKNYHCSRGHEFTAAWPEVVTFSFDGTEEIYCLRCVREFARQYLGAVTVVEEE